VIVKSQTASSSFFVPCLEKRDASGTIELGDGQTMGLAGLLNDNLRETVTKFPGLGSVPVIGALFRSQQYLKGETELVILVTPRLAKPLPAGNIRLPTDSFVEPSDSEFYLLGLTEGKGNGGARQNPAGGQQTN
jgi:pilus assembly protein CpaC